MISFFHKIVDTLNEYEIQYMLSGSVAMSLYVLPRATRDFDFVIHLKEKDIELFTSSFETGFYCDIDSVRDAVKSFSMFNIIDFDSGYRADFVILKNSPFRKMEFERKQKVIFMDREVFVVNIEDLIISKIIWIQDLQSSIQMDDINQLLENKNIDRKYIQYWIEQLKLKTFNLL